MGMGVKDFKTADLEPGMVIARDIVTPTGHILMPAGTKLTSKHVRMLNARGIDRIAVATTDGRTAPTSSPTAEETARQIARRFQHNDPGQPFIGELMRLCESRMSDRE